MTVLKRSLIHTMCFAATLLLAALSLSRAEAQVYHIGPSHEIKKPSDIAGHLRNGDELVIEAATYSGDVTAFYASDLIIRSNGGKAVFDAAGEAIEGKGIWVIKGDNTRISGIHFKNARVSDRNGAGIRLEGKHLTVSNCEFSNNENGILTGVKPLSKIKIENSIFRENGHGDGQSHQVYVGHVMELAVSGSYFWHARVGHHIKSRARKNLIEYNLIADGPEGNSSYLIDLPNGGEAVILGNILWQGKHTDNSTAISYGTLPLEYLRNTAYIGHNSFLNEYPGGTFIKNASNETQFLVMHNLFSGKGKILAGPGKQTNNSHATHNVYRDSKKLLFEPDSKIKSQPNTNPAIADAPLPTRMYQHPASSVPRKTTKDLGAIESIR